MNLIMECLFGIGINAYIRANNISLVNGKTYFLDPCGGKTVNIRYDKESLVYFVECPRGEKFYWPSGEYENVRHAMNEHNYIKLLSPVMSSPFLWIHYESRKGAAIADYLEENLDSITAKEESILVVAPSRYHNQERIERLSKVFGKIVVVNKQDQKKYNSIASAIQVADIIVKHQCRQNN